MEDENGIFIMEQNSWANKNEPKDRIWVDSKYDKASCNETRVTTVGRFARWNMMHSLDACVYSAAILY